MFPGRVDKMTLGEESLTQTVIFMGQVAITVFTILTLETIKKFQHLTGGLTLK